MLRVALIGLGKMGLSHLAILNSHPDVELVGVCDPVAYVVDLLGKYTPLKCYTDYLQLLDYEKPDAVVIATPTRLHGEMVEAALERGMCVYCEKPFSLNIAEGRRLVALAESKGLVNQVGYHYRFVATFQEMKRIIDAGTIGRLHHVNAEAYGAVVRRPAGSTWRTSNTDGGGCLYDYASHALDLVNYLVGRPDAVGGTVLNKIFSAHVDDEVYSNLFWSDGKAGRLAANWSDDSYRKMSTKVTVWGTKGKIAADRQEVQIFLREGSRVGGEFAKGWNVLYTTELTKPVWYYLRGEEYSAQIDHFVQCIKEGRNETLSSFHSALETDIIVSLMKADAERPPDHGQARPVERIEPRGISRAIRHFLR